MEARERGKGGDDTENNGQLFVEIVEDEGNVIKVGAGDGRERRGSSVKSGDEGNNGEGEEEGGKGAALLEAIGYKDDKVSMVEGENNVLGMGVQVLQSIDNVSGAAEELK